MIALLIGYESISRILRPVPIHLAEAIPIACLGLAVNIASAWLLVLRLPRRNYGKSAEIYHYYSKFA
jgi:Co/Zn/Cd efflux system component